MSDTWLQWDANCSYRLSSMEILAREAKINPDKLKRRLR
ncbi:hypothetical protein TRICHSKD4_2510 [Roseibium sp. TrichSKD4]|nr:hypothetical protein TRICHSKD4_2510 [Roseibium sp. TrichSKD4]